MDLWIRSQDKHLLAKYNMLAVAQVTPKTQANIMAFVSDDLGYQKLGAYNTKERALEVLDEIQKIVNEKPIILVNSRINDKEIKRFGDGFVIADNSQNIIPATSVVYQMPEE